MELKMSSTLLVFLFLIIFQSYAAGIRHETSANNIKSSSNVNDTFIEAAASPNNESSLVDSIPEKRYGIKESSDSTEREKFNVEEFAAKFSLTYIKSLVDALVDSKLNEEKSRKDNSSEDAEESSRSDDTESGDSARGFISRRKSIAYKNQISSSESASSDSNNKVPGKIDVNSESSQDDSTIESRNQVVETHSPESNENKDSQHPKTVCYKQDSKNPDKYILISKESALKDHSDSEVKITCVNSNRLNLSKFKTGYDYSNSYETHGYVPPHVNHHTFSDSSYLDSNYHVNPYPKHNVPVKHEYGYPDHYIQNGYFPEYPTPEFNEYNKLNYAHNTGLHQNYQNHESSTKYDTPNYSSFYPLKDHTATQSYEYSNEYKPLQQEYHHNGIDHKVIDYVNNNFQHKSGHHGAEWNKKKNHHPIFPPTAHNNNYNSHDSSYYHQKTEDNHIDPRTNSHIIVVKDKNNKSVKFDGPITLAKRSSSQSKNDASNLNLGYPKKPHYYRLGDQSEAPTTQKVFRVLRPTNFTKYLVSSHDFNVDFIETIYVADNFSTDSTDYTDGDLTICNPCNRNFNKDYPRYNDWNERYVSCKSFIPYSQKEQIKPRIVNSSPKLCNNDAKYEKICNPCGRKTKIAFVAETSSEFKNVYLPFEQITQTQESFFDDNLNKYDFTSLKDHNLDFDSKYGDPLNPNYDSSEIYKYYRSSHK